MEPALRSRGEGREAGGERTPGEQVQGPEGIGIHGQGTLGPRFANGTDLDLDPPGQGHQQLQGSAASPVHHGPGGDRTEGQNAHRGRLAPGQGTGERLARERSGAGSRPPLFFR